jgi:mRNA deadenylase 3'-5' endonuclease subunit Ccr4
MPRTLTATTYNVLANAYLRAHYYPHSELGALEPEGRLARLLQQVVALDSDVLCLQEVEASVFGALAEALEPVGFGARYAQKQGDRLDGCATFYRQAALHEEHCTTLVYDDGDPPTGHVALMMLLRHEGHLLRVANTHLKWEPHETPPEARRALHQVRQLVRACAEPGADGCLIAGDFNATPESGIIAEVRAEGFVDPHAGLGHIFTCNSNGRAKRVDYVFASRALVAEPSGALVIVADDTPLPSYAHPSDHLPLSIELEWARP